MSMDLKDVVDKVNTPSVGVPAAGGAWLVGHVSAEQWLTYLSLLFVACQLIIAIPKLLQTVRIGRKKLESWVQKWMNRDGKPE